MTITKYTGTDTDVSIPESIKGMPVTVIGDSAFQYCDTVRSVTFPDSVVKIESFVFTKCYALEHVTLGSGIREIDTHIFSFCDRMNYTEYQNGCYVGTVDNPYYALACASSTDIGDITIHPDTVIICGGALDRCKQLRELDIPDGVISIGSFAFEYCSYIKTIHIPKTVESIGTMAFESCDSIQKITVSDENTSYKSVNGSLFSRDGTRLIKYVAAQDTTNYKVPDGTVIIDHNAFENAKKLTHITLPDSVEEIGHSAFIHCEGLRSISLGNGLKCIGGQAFGYCSSLTTLTLPDSVETVSYAAFSYCPDLESVTVGNGVVEIGDNAFDGCTALKKIVFESPEGWKIAHMHTIFPKNVDVSDPEQNVSLFRDEYSEYYWYKK